GNGNIFVAQTFNTRKVTSAGVVTTIQHPIGDFYHSPQGIAVDASGVTYVADTPTHRIIKQTITGQFMTIAGHDGTAWSQDGSGGAARFNYPTGIAIDSHGVIFVADRDNNTIRRIAPDGSVTTIGGVAGIFGGTDGFGNAGTFNRPVGIAVSSTGVLYVAD